MHSSIQDRLVLEKIQNPPAESHQISLKDRYASIKRVDYQFDPTTNTIPVYVKKEMQLHQRRRHIDIRYR